jgi:flagellar biosynthesis/type III secretory pathway chaperone
MSGPKISEVELERQREEALRKTHEERLRQIQEATDDYYEAIKEAKKIKESISRDRASIVEMVKTSVGMERTVASIAAKKSEHARKVLALTQMPLPLEAHNISKAAAKIRSQATSLRADYESDKEVNEHFDRVGKHIEDLRRQNELEKIEKEMQKSRPGDLPAFVDIDIRKEMIANSEKLANDLKEAAKAAMDGLLNMAESDGVAHDDRKRAKDIARRISAAASENEGTLRSALTQYDIAKRDITERIEHFASLYKVYLSAYAGYYNTLNDMREYRTPSEPLTPKAPKGAEFFTSATHIKAHIDELHRRTRQANEQNKKNYIRAQIAEVMRLFGYNMCEDIVLSEADTGNHFLYPHDVDGTGLHVYMSGSGDIMIETVGTGSRKVDSVQKRTAVVMGNSELKPNEREALLHKQEMFCELYPKIVEELKKRGVIIKKRTHNKPDVKFAKRILRLVTGKAYIPPITGEGISVKQNKERREEDRYEEKTRELDL